MARHHNFDDATDFEDVELESDIGEPVEVTNVRDDRVCLHFPDREPHDPDSTACTEWRHYEALAGAIDDGVFVVVGNDTDDEPNADVDARVEGEFVNTPIRCPNCGGFMSTGFDPAGFPTAGCSNDDCHITHLPDDWLVSHGYFEK